MDTPRPLPRPMSPGLGEKLSGYKDVKDFVASLQKPRCVSPRDGGGAISRPLR
jgi:hypothetical protein